MEKDQSALSCLVIILNLLHTKYDAELLEKYKSETKIDEVLLLRIAKQLKLSSRLCNVKIKNLKKISYPFIAKTTDDSFFVIVKSKEDKTMILFPEKVQPEIVTHEQLSEMWDGTSVLITNRSIIDKEAAFSFKWFFPTILKFKKEFIQVLVAVFTVQILGILTPLMTQVVVDKVLVHNSLSTLQVLSIGIALVYIFEFVLSLAKNYVSIF